MNLNAYRVKNLSFNYGLGSGRIRWPTSVAHMLDQRFSTHTLIKISLSNNFTTTQNFGGTSSVEQRTFKKYPLNTTNDIQKGTFFLKTGISFFFFLQYELLFPDGNCYLEKAFHTTKNGKSDFAPSENVLSNAKDMGCVMCQQSM